MNDNSASEIAQLCERISGLNETSLTKPVLVYFDIIGIAWPIRCALHIKDVDYELLQISLKQWAYRDNEGVQRVKQCFRNGHVPLYVDENVCLNQSMVILNYLADKFELGGRTFAERCTVSEVCAHAYDALFHWNGLLQIIIKIGIADDIVNARSEAFMGNGVWGIASNGFNNHLDGFVRYLQSNPSDSGYFVGEELTIADLHAFNILCNWYKAFAPERFVSGYPALEDFIQRIAAIPVVRDYIDNRQEATTWFNMPNLAIKLTSPKELKGLVGR